MLVLCRKLWNTCHKLTLILPLFLLAGCAMWEQFQCAPHNGSSPAPFPENQLTECLSTSTYWVSHPVFCIGVSQTKPPILLLHELPGLSPQTLYYAEALSADFSVYVPLLYGEPNQNSVFKGAFSFHTNGEWEPQQELDGSSRILNWLQHITRQIELHHPHQAIGAIGNCMTGAIPLALLNNHAVRAVVLAQPTLPLPFFQYSDDDKRSLGISEHARTQALSRKDARVLLLRFETDCVSKPEKRTALLRDFGDRLVDGEIPKEEYQPPTEDDSPKVHSTLIGAFDVDGRVGKASRDKREQVKQFLLLNLTAAR